MHALTLHLEIISERLRKQSGGELPAQYGRSIRAMHEQVQKLDRLVQRVEWLAQPQV